MKKNLKTRIYVTLLTLVMMFAMTTISYGAVIWEYFSYESYHYGYKYLTENSIKGDDSSAVAAYDNGPYYADKMYVEILGSLYDEGTYTNYTLRHLYDGKYVQYYTVPLGQEAFIYNLVYETTGTSTFTKLRVYIYGTGNVLGRWSPSTR